MLLKRMILLLTVAALMAAMVALSAVPATADDAPDSDPIYGIPGDQACTCSPFPECGTRQCWDVDKRIVFEDDEADPFITCYPYTSC